MRTGPMIGWSTVVTKSFSSTCGSSSNSSVNFSGPAGTPAPSSTRSHSSVVRAMKMASARATRSSPNARTSGSFGSASSGGRPMRQSSSPIAPSSLRRSGVLRQPTATNPSAVL